MPTLLQFFISALYVTFAYAVIAIGALVYRRIVDLHNLKAVQLGEELYAFFDPRAFVAIGTLLFFFSIFVLMLLLKSDLTHEEVNRSAPGLLFMVIPMVIAVNIVQIYYRAKWQRTQLRTKGIVVLRLFSERFHVIEFETVSSLNVVPESFWVRADVLRTNGEVVELRINRSSLDVFLTTVQNRSRCTITGLKN